MNSLRSTLSSLSRTRQVGIGLFIIALIATSGSLYLSVGLGLIPCKYCWYQRILMYPLVPVTLYAIYRNELFTPLIGFFSVVGMAIASYHSYIQVAPSGKFACETMCSAVLYTVGPLTVPNLSAIAFTLILTGVIIAQYHGIGE